MNDQHHDDGRLSRIDTLWSVVKKAHGSDAELASSAQQQLLDRYSGAIRRYLLGAVRNRDLADELFQDFAVKFIRGDFKSADPDRGKFRSFVKTVLFRMVALHFRKKSASKVQAVENVPEAEDNAELPEYADDELFIKSWRDDVLARTWEAMKNSELSGGAPYNTVLRIRVENPASSSTELAGLLSKALGKTITSGNARVQIHRARECFSNFLIENVADSLPNATREAIEGELIELKLIDYCRENLDSYQGFQKE